MPANLTSEVNAGHRQSKLLFSNCYKPYSNLQNTMNLSQTDTLKLSVILLLALWAVSMSWVEVFADVEGTGTTEQAQKLRTDAGSQQTSQANAEPCGLLRVNAKSTNVTKRKVSETMLTNFTGVPTNELQRRQNLITLGDDSKKQNIHLSRKFLRVFAGS